jgi:hypothetical protein
MASGRIVVDERKENTSIKYLAFLALVVSCGCGGVTSVANPVGPTAVTMQQGQWELVATPSSGLAPIYVEANFTVSNGDVNSTVFNTSLFQNVGAIVDYFLIAEIRSLREAI